MGFSTRYGSNISNSNSAPRSFCPTPASRWTRELHLHAMFPDCRARTSSDSKGIARATSSHVPGTAGSIPSIPPVESGLSTPACSSRWRSLSTPRAPLNPRNPRLHRILRFAIVGVPHPSSLARLTNCLNNENGLHPQQRAQAVLDGRHFSYDSLRPCAKIPPGVLSAEREHKPVLSDEWLSCCAIAIVRGE
jgi:hypothetical protein